MLWSAKENNCDLSIRHVILWQPTGAKELRSTISTGHEPCEHYRQTDNSCLNGRSGKDGNISLQYSEQSLAVVAHVFNYSFRRQRQVEFEANLVYKENPSTARALIQRNTVLKKTNKHNPNSTQLETHNSKFSLKYFEMQVDSKGGIERALPSP